MDQYHFTLFKYLFWFCVGVFVVSFVAMMALIFIDYPERNREMAANTQGFLQGSLIMSAVGFLLTGSINTQKKNDQKVTTEVTTDSTKVITEPATTKTTENDTTNTNTV